jgi:hypothetical protein
LVSIATTWARLTGLGIGCSVLAAVGQGVSLPDMNEYTGSSIGTEVEGCDEETVARFASAVQWHASYYPDLQVEDVYKLLHQSVAGPAHAIENPDVARQWLDREWDGLGEPFNDEEMFEPLSSDGRLVRLNLRPWRAAGHSPEAVLSAFVRTAETLPPDSARIRVELDAISACSDRIAGGLRLSATELQSFFSDRERDGYPMIHHSEKYTQAYQPAYRVVFRSYLD